MTNLDHYGFDNLVFNDLDVNDEYACFEVYHKPKHAKNKILLRRIMVDVKGLSKGLIKQKIVDHKALWLLSRFKSYKECGGWCNGYTLDGYMMRHY